MKCLYLLQPHQQLFCSACSTLQVDLSILVIRHGISRLQETWIQLNELNGALLCFLSLVF